MISTRLSVVGLFFWSVFSTVWLRKTRTTARLVVAETSPAPTTFAHAEASYLTIAVFKASDDWREVLLERGGGLGQDLAEVLVEVLVVVAGQIDRVALGGGERARAGAVE